ncbi:hypothetical protein SETIT_1G170000v2 [Setaria italica]|uniref:Uncharacterized protein n=1 Tax=Setaria italica TaxID=4555 RepID=A0A368PL70_SETIT|nr:hypothetical protein SETIT_1G170000v2 [Setaria italica]
MDLYLLFHTVLMHISAAIVILIYIPLSIPVKLFVWAFVKPLRKEDLRGKVVLITGSSSGIGECSLVVHGTYNHITDRGVICSMDIRARRSTRWKASPAARERGAPDVLVVPGDVSDPEQSRRAVEETVAYFGKLNHLVANAGAWSICFFDEITNITASTKMMDVNFWGSVYPTYYALPHLKASKGKLIVSSSIAATAPTSRLSLYNATKAAQLRFYETLRSELGSEVGVTTLTAGFVESEMTKGKAIQRDGEVAVDEEARDVSCNKARFSVSFFYVKYK